MSRPAPTSVSGAVAALLATGCGASSVAAAGKATSPSTAGRVASRTFRVPGASMEPTLPIGTRVVVAQRTPSVGAIVVYHPPDGFDQQECGPTPHALRPGGAACADPVPRASRIEAIQRIVAGPGDRIVVRAGHVDREAHGSNRFVREGDSYIRACGGRPECNVPDLITIPDGHWFVMGDDRGLSLDSRFFGPVPTAWIVGTATALECRSFVPGRPPWVRRTPKQGCVHV